MNGFSWYCENFGLGPFRADKNQVSGEEERKGGGGSHYTAEINQVDPIGEEHCSFNSPVGMLTFGTRNDPGQPNWDDA